MITTGRVAATAAMKIRQTPTTITCACGSMEAAGTASIAITTGNTMAVITAPIVLTHRMVMDMALHLMVDFMAVMV